MAELEIGLTDGGELNFDQSSLQFNVKKSRNFHSVRLTYLTFT